LVTGKRKQDAPRAASRMRDRDGGVCYNSAATRFSRRLMMQH
jgi:hypothetical protein